MILFKQDIDLVTIDFSTYVSATVFATIDLLVDPDAALPKSLADMIIIRCVPNSVTGGSLNGLSAAGYISDTGATETRRAANLSSLNSTSGSTSYLYSITAPDSCKVLGTLSAMGWGQLECHKLDLSVVHDRTGGTTTFSVFYYMRDVNFNVG